MEHRSLAVKFEVMMVVVVEEVGLDMVISESIVDALDGRLKFTCSSGDCNEIK